MLAGFLDLTTTEVADMLVGGVFPADRGPASARRSAPAFPMSARSARSTWSISVRATPCRRSSASRKFVVHNPNVTLMRTTRDENRAARRMDRRAAQPDGRSGPLPAARRAASRCSTRPGKPFHDPEADNALFEAIEKTVRQTGAAPGRARAREHQRTGFRRRGGRGLRHAIIAAARRARGRERRRGL